MSEDSPISIEPEAKKESIRERDRRIGQEQRGKYFFHEQEPSSLAEVAQTFQNDFPEYALTENEESGSFAFFGIVRGKKPTPFIHLHPSFDYPKGFWIQTGELKAGQPSDPATLKMKGVDVSPIYRSEDPDTARAWDAFETGEATELVRLKQQRPVIDDALLSQPSTWDTVHDKPFALREHLGYMIAQRFVTDDRLGPLKTSADPVVPRLFRRGKDIPPKQGEIRVGQEELRKVALARLNHFGQESISVRGIGEIPLQQALQEVRDGTKLGDLIIRKQVVQLEALISLIQRKKFTLGVLTFS